MLRHDTSAAYPLELLTFRRFWIFSPALQMAVVAALYTVTTLLFVRTFRLTGKMLGGAPDVWILFVPITEEILFRGLILGALEIVYGRIWAVVISSGLFGLWHLKNAFWMGNAELLQEIAYTTLLFGPVTGILALKSRSIWPGVILHYLNNLPAVTASSLSALTASSGPVRDNAAYYYSVKTQGPTPPGLVLTPDAYG